MSRLEGDMTPSADAVLDPMATAERMTKMHGSNKAYERADDHACSYPSWSWQYKYWTDVAANILRIQKEAKR